MKNILPSATAQELAELAKSNNDNICRQVAQHPNTSPETLKQLFQIYPKQVLNNPTVNLLLSGNSSLLIELYHENQWCFNSELPLFFLEWGANNSDYQIRWSVAKSANTPISILDKLASDEDSLVRSGVASNPKISNEIAKQLAKDKSERVRPKIAANINTPEYILEQLAEDKTERVRWEVADNINTPEYILEQLAKDKSERVRWEVASNINTSEYTLEQLAEHKDKLTIQRIARNPNTNLATLKKLAKVIIKENHELYMISWLVAHLNATEEFKEQTRLMCNENNKFDQICVKINDYNCLKCAIDIEMERLGWSRDTGRSYLQNQYGKRSRLHLTPEQLMEFWQYLLNLPTSNPS